MATKKKKQDDYIYVNGKLVKNNIAPTKQSNGNKSKQDDYIYENGKLVPNKSAVSPIKNYASSTKNKQDTKTDKLVEQYSTRNPLDYMQKHDAEYELKKMGYSDDDLKTLRKEYRKNNNDLDIFRKGAFDRDDVGSVEKTILGVGGTGLHIARNLLEGAILNPLEGGADAIRYGTAYVLDTFGADETAQSFRDVAKEDDMQKLLSFSDEYFERNSVLGNDTQGFVQALGQVFGLKGLGKILSSVGLGAKGIATATTGTTFLTSAGSGTSEAYKGGATDKEALKYGLLQGGIDAGTELLSGGLGKSTKALGLSHGVFEADDLIAKSLTKNMKNQTAKNSVQALIKGFGEGGEEWLAGYLSAHAQKGTYRSEDDFEDIKEDQELGKQFFTGMLVSDIAQVGSVRKASKLGVDYVTGNTQNEQKVIDSIVDEEIKKAEQEGKKLTTKEVNKIKDDVEKMMDRGEIDLETIEKTLGGETYTKLQDLKKEVEEYETLRKMKNGDRTDIQNDRLLELKAKNQKTPYGDLHNQLKEELSTSVREMTKNDSRLQQSYLEKAKKSQSYEVDKTKKYSEKELAIVNKAKESGFLNNTRKTHEMVDLVAKLSSEQNMDFDFATNQSLKDSGFAIEGKTINGFKQGNKITVNVQSKNALNSVVGHEITHVLEGTDLYKTLQDTVIEYAKQQGVYDAKYKDIVHLYRKQFQDNNLESRKELYDSEITADLVGEYIFSDVDFVKSLSTKDRNLFQKIYDEIKYFIKTVTAGSDAEKQLLKAKKIFEDVYRENRSIDNADADVKFSIREEAPPKETGIAYKVFYVKDGKLYPPMVANPNGAETPIGVWLNADVGTSAPPSKTGRPQVKAGGKGTQGGSGSLAFRPGWHLGDLPRASQFDRVNPETGKKELFPENFVWAEVEYAKDVDYQEEAMSYGYTENGKFRHAYAGLPRLPENGYYRYRTNPKPDTVPWVITGAMKVNRLLSDAEVNAILEENGVPPIHRQGGDVELEKFGFNNDGTVKDIDNGVKVMDDGSAIKYSLSSWTPETQTKVRDNLVKAGYETERVNKWIDDVNGVASVIASNKDRLDFEASDNQTMLKNNQEYVKTLDASTLCAKRLVYQGTFDAIQHRLPNTVLTSDDLIELSNMMKENGVEAPCSVCYVESRRRHLGKFAQEWLDGYDGEYKPNLDEVTTSDGLEKLRHTHPQTYNDFVNAMNKKGSSNPKVVQLRTNYRNEIMALTPSQVRKIEAIGGLRVQSFSDFETPHLLDMMQAVMDMSAKGLTSQAYTKVPNFAWVFGNTGIKINLSLIAEGDGFDSNGNLAFSSVEGMDINDAMKLRDAYSENVGTIIVGANDKHILACMSDDRIDYIIPFHRSGWGQNELKMMGMDSYDDYTYGQKEHYLNKPTKVVNGVQQYAGVENNLYPPDYWDYNLTGKENAERYLNLCEKTGREPKFSQFLVDNGDGSYSLQPDGSTDGYWKMLIDFKMYDNDGKGVAQQKVQPNFNMEEAFRVLDEYEGGANSLPVANEIVEKFVAKYKSENLAPTKDDVKYSLSQDTEDIDSWLDDLTIDDLMNELLYMGFDDFDDISTDVAPIKKQRTKRRVDEVNKRLKEIGLKFNGTKSASWTDERIEKYLDGGYYGSNNPNYAQAYITYMSPYQFLNLTTGGNTSTLDMIQNESAEYGEVDFEKLGNDSPVRLYIEEGKNGAKVVGHEGRHRMYLLGQAGFEKIPILMFDYNTKYNKSYKNSLKLTAQRFNDTDFISKTRDVTAWDVVPFSQGNRDVIIEKFGSGNKTSDVQYSLSEDKSIQDSYTKDSEGRTLTEAQQEKFKDSVIRDENGYLKPLYHGTNSMAFTEFNMNKGVWLSETQSYSEVYAGQWHSWRDDYEDAPTRSDINGLEKEVYADEDYRIYELYADIKNPFDLGEINGTLSEGKVSDFANRLGHYVADQTGDMKQGGAVAREVRTLAKEYIGEKAYTFTRTKEFMDYAKQLGFDGFIATEGGRKTYAVFNSADQLKLTTNENPTDNPDIRYSLTENNQDIAPRKSGNIYSEDVMLESQPLGLKDIAPIRSGSKNISASMPKPLEGDNEVHGVRIKGNSQQAERQEIAKVLAEEPKTENQRNKRKWAIFKANVFDKGAVFEDLSLKAKNRDLMGKWDYTLTSEARAQYLMGNGDTNAGVKSLNSIRESVAESGRTKEFYDYMYHALNVDRMTLEERFHNTENKPVFGYEVGADESRAIVQQYENDYPEFRDWARQVYDYQKYLRKELVYAEIITEETAELWSKMYPHYIPIRRADGSNENVNVFKQNRIGINAPIQRAVGGNTDILPLFDTMAMRTQQTYRATARNNFGVELKYTLGDVGQDVETSIDDVIDGVSSQGNLLLEGMNGRNPRFTVFEDGKKKTFEITKDMYDALKPLDESSFLSKTIKPLNVASNFHKGLLTQYNPIFMLTNAIKDTQDVFINSQHSLKTYSKVPEALKQITQKGYWYEEYMRNGGEQNSYFDSETHTFKTEDEGLKKLLNLPPLSTISKMNNFVELIPRLSEYIASREMGATVETAMLDASRVTTNFKAGGDFTKFLNRNGVTFLNASVQGAMQQVRNVREAKANGLKGWVNLAVKFGMAGLPVMLLNGLIWDDDEEYEELSDYVKQNYYVVYKTDDGQFFRIPKGRAMAVIQDAFQQVSNFATGDDEVDMASFLELAVSNLAPNNPLENNVLSPLLQVKNNKTWYGEDLVPSRLQDLPSYEQYDESTDRISKWLGNTELGKKLEISPVKMNYLLNQYSGGVGDVVLPMLTPEAEHGEDTLGGNLIAPLKDKFITDSTLNNQNISDFYDLSDELTMNAKMQNATDEDVLMNKYINSVKSEMNELYAQKREIQNSDLSNNEKYEAVKKVQRQIVELAKEGLNNYTDVNISGNYSTVGDRQYMWYESEDGTEGSWKKLTEKQLAKQEEVTNALDIAPSDYWSNKGEYDYAYEKPSKYALAKSLGGYETYTAISDVLWDIKADKDANGNSINGTRKTKVLDYVNSLDIPYEMKLILFKSEYNSFDDANNEIIEYLNNREDISYEEEVSILKELGFTVSSDGRVSW